MILYDFLIRIHIITSPFNFCKKKSSVTNFQLMFVGILIIKLFIDIDFQPFDFDCFKS